MSTTWNLDEAFESPFAEMSGASYAEMPATYTEMPQPYAWLPGAPVPEMPAEPVRMPLAHESPQQVNYPMVQAGGGLWVPGAERVANPKSGGGSYLDAPWRFVFHTIEGEPSEAGFRRLAAEHANPPHLWAMPSANLLLQTIPLDRSAYALARPGSVHTNRRRAVQVEVLGFAAKMGNLGPREIEWLADRLLAPVARLVPINLEHVRPTGDDTACYGERSGCRMTPEEWERFDGVCGHQHVPDNKHWDPGRMPLQAIAARAREIIRGGGQPAREQQLADHDGPNFAAERDEDEFESWAGGFEYDTPPPVAAYAPPPPGPPPAPPNPPLTGPEPVKRNCCLLDPKSLKDLSTMGTYSTYGAVNSGNPGTVYTSKAGFVDLGHLFAVADVTAYAYQQIRAAAGAVGTTIKTAHGTAKIDVAIPNTHWLEYARKVAYDDSVAYEIWTSKGAASFLPGNLNSSFSPEDLCSNYLGTVVTANALNTPSAMSFPGRVDSEVRKLLAFLGVQSNVEAGKAFALKNNIWIAWNNDASGANPYYLRRRNFSEKPWLAGHPKDQPGAWAPVPFPSMLLYTYRHNSGFTDRDFYKEISIFRTWAQATFGVDYDKP